jgi:lactoylglutathione lyase
MYSAEASRFATSGSVGPVMQLPAGRLVLATGRHFGFGYNNGKPFPSLAVNVANDRSRMPGDTTQCRATTRAQHDEDFMRLNQINLPVPDVAAARDFFVKYFGFAILEEKGRGTLVVLRDDVGLALTLSNFAKTTQVSYPKDFHVGFVVDTQAQVDEIFRRLTADGIAAEPPQHLHGGWSFYVSAPGGILVEVVSYEGES